MVYTCGDVKASFSHILNNVLGQDDGTPLKLAWSEEGIDDIFALSNLTDNDIDYLKYINKNHENDHSPIRMAKRHLLGLSSIL
jgi:hypothetical protein